MKYSYVANYVGVVGQSTKISTEKEAAASAAISVGVARLLENGYRRFVVSITGDTTLIFTLALLSMRNKHPDIFMDVLFPFIGWDKPLQNSAHYLLCMKQADSVLYACEEANEDSAYNANIQLQDFGKCTVVIHDGKDNPMQTFISGARDMEQDVYEIII